MLFSILQFGKLSWLFSDIAMSGYTSGAGLHLLVSQLAGLFGLSLPKRIGPLLLIYVRTFRFCLAKLQ